MLMAVSQTLGVHSEVGKLRTVLVCRPGLAHQRLTPGNRADLLFDDVLWVQEAQKDHYDFVLQDARARRRGARAARPAGRDAGGPRRRALGCSTAGSPPTTSASGMADVMRPWLDEMPAAQAGRAPDRRHRDLDLPDERDGDDAGRRLRRHRFHHAADAEHAVPARPVVLDLQRRDLQPDVLAGAQAGDAAAARGLQVPSALQGRRLQDLVGRLRRVLRRRHRSKAATSCRSARASC